MMDLGTNYLISLWFWWSHAAAVPLWNPFGAVLTIAVILALFGFGIKHILGDD